MNEALVAGLVGIAMGLIELTKWALKRSDGDNQRKLLYTMKQQIDDLHAWHDREDGEGVKIWYVRKSLEEAITKLANNIETQTEIMRTLVTDMRDIRRGCAFTQEEKRHND